MTYADPRSGYYIGPDLWLDPATMNQYAGVCRKDGEVTVHKRAWPSGSWSSYQFTGEARTILDLPTAYDDHNCPALAVDGLGYVHFFSNMHECTTMQFLKSSTAGSITSWVQNSLPSMPSGYRLTYPHFTRFSDGTLMLLMRAEGAHDNSTYHVWTLGPTDTAWTKRSKLLDGQTTSPTRGAYTTHHYSDPITGRVHLGFVWRVNNVDTTVSHEKPSYIYTDDGITWKSIGGTTMSLPITPTNNTSCQTHTHDSVDLATIWNGGGCCADQNGYPVFTVNRSSAGGSKDVVRWNGSAWTTYAWTNNGGTGPASSGRPNLFMLGGKLHALVTGPAPDPRRIRLINMDDNKLVGEYCYVYAFDPLIYTSSWDQVIDANVLTTQGKVQFLVDRKSVV